MEIQMVEEEIKKKPPRLERDREIDRDRQTDRQTEKR